MNLKSIGLVLVSSTGLAQATLLAQSTALAKPYVSSVWVADQGDGTYQNPILHADYSDPDVIRVGADYYMTASSFNCTPGLPILHSRDLVNWTLVGHALKKQFPEAHFAVPKHGDGCWAPCLRFHDGQFYIYWGDPDFGIYRVKTAEPSGEWSIPELVLEGKGLIDPSPLWDDQGNAWLVHGWAGSRAGVNSLLTVHRMSIDGSKVLDDGKHVFDGHDQHPTVEGPKFYQRNGYFYILAPAGGVATGWQLTLRSKNIYGPYEAKIVLEQGHSTVNGPHQGAWVDSPDGEAWFIHFQDRGAYGRIVHLQPMTWKSDWPMMGTDKDGDQIGEPVLRHTKPKSAQNTVICSPQESDEFDTDELGLQWQWHANPRVIWSALLPGKGFLRLFPIGQAKETPNLWDTPNLLLQKFPAPDFTVTTLAKWTVDSVGYKDKRAGLLIMGNDYACLTISRDEQGYQLSQTICKNAPAGNKEQLIAQQRLPGNSAYLRVQITGPEAWCQFSFSTEGVQYLPIGEPFQAKPDTWIGAKVGLFCSSFNPAKRGGYADFEWFRVEK